MNIINELTTIHHCFIADNDGFLFSLLDTETNLFVLVKKTKMTKLEKTEEELLFSFKNDICLKSDIDPTKTLDWISIAIGYFIAKGCTIQKAWDLSNTARYKHEYWLYELDK